MTEEEAKTKWCPFARFAMPAGVNTNRPPAGYLEGEAAVRCIGAGCMAWRISTAVHFDGHGRVVGPASPHIDHARTLTTGGYCGLAGQP